LKILFVHLLRNLGLRSTPVVPDHHVEVPVITNCSTAIDTRTPIAVDRINYSFPTIHTTL